MQKQVTVYQKVKKKKCIYVSGAKRKKLCCNIKLKRSQLEHLKSD